VNPVTGFDLEPEKFEGCSLRAWTCVRPSHISGFRALKNDPQSLFPSPYQFAKTATSTLIEFMYWQRVPPHVRVLRIYQKRSAEGVAQIDIDKKMMQNHVLK
jgi:hypothetical protein